MERLSKGAGSGGVEDTAGQKSSFADLLRDVVGEAVDAGQKAEKASLGAMGGKRPELTDIVTAVNNAEMAVETVTAVRDRVINAYQEIMRMPI